jgi:hypothetical protein
MRTSWALLVLVFVSGALSGFFVGRGQLTRHMGDAPTREEVLARWAYECHLDPDQKATFEGIMKESHTRVAALKKAFDEEKVAPIRSDVRAKLRAVLRDEQKPLFDAYCKERDRQRDESMR